jgi:Lon-like protease
LFTDDDARVESTVRRGGRRVGWLMMAVTVFGMLGLAVLPSPYVIERPGPVIDTLGSVTVDGVDVPLIEIPEEPTYPTEGSLSLLTVNVLGNPESSPSWFEVMRAWITPSQSVVPVDQVFPPGVSTEQRREQSRVDMVNSQREAIAAALRALGEPYESRLVVVDILEGSPAEGIVRPDDEIVAVNGVPVRDVTALRAEIATNGAGVAADVTIRRNGAEQSVSITPVLSEGTDRVPVIGVLIAGEYEFPIDVRIQLDNVGGPSAGMMFALGIIDKLTPGSLSGGAEVAGTGTIAADGSIGRIGGVVQKMHGALGVGADVFLAPRANCAEISGNIPSNLDVFPVATLNEAIAVLQAVEAGGPTDGFARCGS